MRYIAEAPANGEMRPQIWRIAVVVIGMLILSSCRGPAGHGVGSHGPPSAMPPYPALPPEAFTGAPPAGFLMGPAPIGPPGMEMGIPLPYAPAGPWAPPGFRQPWPSDEYLADGGDWPPDAQVMPDWEVRGLNVEDTIAHYDTLDGRTLVEPSNRVHIYSPRFRAVRQVVAVRQNQQRDQLVGAVLPTGVAGHEEILGAGTSTQNLQPQRQVSQSVAIAYRTRQGDGAVSAAIGPIEFQNRFQPYEDFSVIRSGVVQMAEMAFLAEGVTAALTWNHNQAVEILLDRQRAAVEVGVDRVSTIYTVDEPPACPKLRVIKVASTQFAEPGDTVDFTIRFDNIGNQPIGNVTILDNLTPRLAYVSDTAQSSIPAQFSVVPNEVGSAVLRWEVDQPIQPGDGGIVRFRCRVL